MWQYLPFGFKILSLHTDFEGRKKHENAGLFSSSEAASSLLKNQPRLKILRSIWPLAGGDFPWHRPRPGHFCSKVPLIFICQHSLFIRLHHSARSHAFRQEAYLGVRGHQLNQQSWGQRQGIAEQLHTTNKSTRDQGNSSQQGLNSWVISIPI